MTQDNDQQAHNPSHPPPPCDPFQRYQTPWPRSGQDDENPFIRFRRFADEQFKSFFSGAPSLRHSFEESFERLAAQHRKEVDERVNAIMERQHQYTRELEDAREHRDKVLQPQRPTAADFSLRRSSDTAVFGRDEADSELDLYHGPFVSDLLDPFHNAGDTYPWLLSSPYSPLCLILPEHRRLKGFTPETSILDAWLYQNRGAELQPNSEFDNKMARVPWQAAFTDLLSITQTGTMRPMGEDRGMESCPAKWLEELLRKDVLKLPKVLTQAAKSLGEVGELRVPSMQGFRAHHSGNEWKQDEDDVDDYDDYDDYDDADPEEKELDDELALSRVSVASTLARALDAMEEVVEGLLIPNPERSRQKATPKRASESIPGQAPSIVSTMTKTETRTLPDGSIEMKRVLKRRFADGMEEHEESVETSPGSREVPAWLRTHLAAADFPTVDKQTQTSDSEKDLVEARMSAKKETKQGEGGWFWR
ncbi:uncharacterized protein HMPREF1541_10829 [Cyphellophora europaea CBS 101466]|uniref:Uncharacterized protein n=1 Tax=Cyphellophora europaea (strain CBS 101466) TaxID=1220924 RepID=W2S7S6_CYPE1|nr:uncharacterized protein HMPREF1541_10829 [Cyphellophora europaea CBS 101466]ETN43964.1 hypothetical protein HMPREF1541_10829 [Cyphellophora europaea CBS 101466]